MMAENTLSESDMDALAGLEERIQRAVGVVSSLRRERDALSAELGTAQAELERLSSEVQTLRAERTQVRGRIEKLLGHIDQLSL